MALTKVKLIADGVIDVDHLAANHGITTDNIGEGSALYYTDARVSSYLTANSYATEGFVTTAVSNLVASAPSTLDTLNELAAALGDDPNFATTVTNSIATKLPLAGGTLTGNLTMSSTNLIAFGSGTQYIKSPDGSDLTIGAADDINFNASYIRYFNTSSSYEYTRLHGEQGDSWINANGGRVGINTNTPTETFHVNGNAYFAGNIGIGYAAQSNIRTFIYDNSSNYSLAVQQDGSGIPFQVTSGGSVRMIVANNGNIGIGTTSPSQKVTIEVDSSAYNALELRDSRAKSSTPEAALSFRGRYSGSAINTMGLIVGAYDNATDANSSANMQFYVNNGSSVVQAMKLQNDSSLAIANGQQASNAISSQIIFGNRGYFSNPAVGGAKIVGVTGSPNWYSGTGLAFYTNPGSDVTSTSPVEKMRITPSGSVGIGTDSPSAKLHVSDSAIINSDLYIGGTSSLRHPALDRFATVQSSANGAIVGYNMAIIDGSNNRRGSLFMDDSTGLWGLDHTYSSGSMDFVVRVAGGELMRVNSEGKVGIGNSSPSDKLSIKNSTGDAGILLEGPTQTLRIDQNSIRTTTNSPIHIFTNNSSGTNSIYLSNNGNVGIGTASPGYKLEVNGSIALEGANALGRQGSSLNPAYNVLLSGGLGFVDLRTPAPGNFKQGTLAFGFTSWNLNNSGGWADMLGLHSYTDYTGGDGNLLIVNRNGSGVKVARQTWNSSTAYSSGTIYTLDYTSVSYQAVKENVQEITNCLNSIVQLRPVFYEWTDEYILNGMSKNTNENLVNEDTGEIILPQNKTTNVGLIAQEVEQVIPTVVHQDNIRLKGKEEPLKNISYDKLVPHLIGAIKELKAEIDLLKAQLNG